MADIVRKQVRDAAVTALTGLTTTSTRVFPSRTHELQDANLPGLRIYTNDEEIDTPTKGPLRERMYTLALVVECCSKKSSGLDNELDLMIQEVQVALDANQAIGGAKYVEPRRREIDMVGEAEKEIGIARLTFEVLYYSRIGAPDVAL